MLYELVEQQQKIYIYININDDETYLAIIYYSNIFSNEHVPFRFSDVIMNICFFVTCCEAIKGN